MKSLSAVKIPSIIGISFGSTPEVSASDHKPTTSNSHAPVSIGDRILIGVSASHLKSALVS